MSNFIRDYQETPIREGNTVSYYDSTGMWLESKVIDVGGALAVETGENPILLYSFAAGHLDDRYVYDGQPIPELKNLSSNLSFGKLDAD